MFLFKNTLLSQTNLIQNSSLEIDSNLQCTGSFTTIKFWDRINSIDYFTDSCHTNYRGIPINQVGESYPKHGIAYAGFVGYYTHPTIEIKEYLHQHLSYSLKQDTTYCLSFFISLAENSTAIGTYKISITDILGREVKQLNFEKSIDISDLEKGIYFVAIVQRGKTLGVKKIIKE